MKENKLVIPVVVIVAIWMVTSAIDEKIKLGCAPQHDTISVKTDTLRDTIVEIRRDTVPKLVTERVTDYVTIEVPYTVRDTVRDSVKVELPVVQKEYGDSTYRAWVSGIGYNDLPRLDSVHVKQRTVVETVTNIIKLQKRQSPIRFGVQAGYGYGLVSGKLEPYVGVGVEWSW